MNLVTRSRVDSAPNSGCVTPLDLPFPLFSSTPEGQNSLWFSIKLLLVNHSITHIYIEINKSYIPHIKKHIPIFIEIHQKLQQLNMSAATRAWIVASSIGAVEALKDQLGVCRWNHALRSLQQHAKSNIRSYTQAKNLSSATSAAVSNKVKRTKEESMRKIMDLSCWGPNTSRF
ncbi:hypothetical protein D0Y65_035129 [Glycine soja]|nr:hypothetical protein D0Y65_035129 [Glycine soja]